MFQEWMLIIAYYDGKTEQMTFATREEAHDEMQRLSRATNNQPKPATMLVTPIGESAPPRQALRRYAAQAVA